MSDPLQDLLTAFAKGERVDFPLERFFACLAEPKSTLVARMLRWCAVRSHMPTEGRLIFAALYGVVNTFGVSKTVAIGYELWRKNAKAREKKRGVSGVQ